MQECLLVTIDQNERVKSPSKQPARLSHQFTCKEKAASYAVPTCLFLSLCELNEGFGCRMFYEEFGDNFCTIVGHRSLAVGFVEHLVKALRTKCPLHQIAKSHSSRHQFLGDAKAACHGCSWSNNSNWGSPATVVCSSHQSLAGGSCS